MKKIYKHIDSEIDDELISTFRDVVNGNSNFVFHVYKEKNVKNQWNPICSCMDWISVAIRAIQEAPQFSSDIDVRVMQTYSLISSIDIVNESITSLFSIFFNQQGRTSPFKGEKRHFLKSDYADDDMHFKEIRAMFGAHPMNLDGGNGERLFASWPHDSFNTDHDLQVILYSNLVDAKDRSFGINFVELFNFLQSRYSYLNDLIIEINRQYQQFCNEKKKVKIVQSSDVMEQLEILSQESKFRLNNDYYNSEIQNLKMIFGAKTEIPELAEKEREFKVVKRKLLSEITNNLQDMNLVDLVQSVTTKRSNIEKELRYEIPKLYQWIYSQKEDSLLEHYIERLNAMTGGTYRFYAGDSPEVTLLKLKMCLHFQ